MQIIFTYEFSFTRNAVCVHVACTVATLHAICEGLDLREWYLMVSVLIYINDLPDGLESTVKLFVDDTLLFLTVYDPNISLTVYDPNISADQLDKDLKIKQ